MKPVVFLRGSLDELRAFPDEARREAGFQIDRVQQGLDPVDWKPMPSIGSGVREIRIRERQGAFRVIYIASFGDAVHVISAFAKKTQKTASRDIDVARARFRALLRGEAS
jgi:phage-related protein